MSKLTATLQAGRTFGVRHGMLRLHYELQRSSGLMARRLRPVQGWQSWELKRIAPGTSAEELLGARRDGTRKFFFSDVHALRTSLAQAIEENGEASIIAEANSILSGNLPFFGQLSFPTGFPPRWFQNPSTGQRVSPQEQWIRMRFASRRYGDLKFILEPSRFLFVYPLVRAYALTGDERFPEAFWASLQAWTLSSPPMSGPLWICGQECSLRILAWSFALQGFIHSPATTSERAAVLVSAIAAHAWRTAQTFGYARSQRSNHLISEGVGLWTAGTLYPELRDAEKWQNLGAKLLHEAVLDQITPNGASHQHSLNYHRMILHLLLWTVRLAEIHGVPLHSDIRERTESAFDFLRNWVDPASGCAPNYGSNDGSLILPLATAEYRDYRPLVQLGSAVLGRAGLESGAWDEPSIWFGLKPRSPAKTALPMHGLPESGYFRLGDDESWAMVRAGRYERRPSQADQLHIDLWWRGLNLARDPGTYLYNGPAPWNNAFAGTALHNTVTVDGRDQMTRAGRFLWLDWAQASGRQYHAKDQSTVIRFEGHHNGYRKLGVKHSRTVQWLKGAGWIIVDDLQGTGEHELLLHWLTPDLPYEFRESPFDVAFAYGGSHIRWIILASAPVDTAIIRAGTRTAHGSEVKLAGRETALLGWESPTYGDLQPAVSLMAQTRSRLPVRFVTVVLTGERYNLESTSDCVSILGPAGQSHKRTEVCKVRIAPDNPALPNSIRDRD